MSSHQYSSHSLAYHPPLDWRQFESFFALRLLPGVEQISARSYLRIFRHNGQVSWFSVHPAEDRNALELRIYNSHSAIVSWLVPRVRHMFDLDLTPGTIDEHFSHDNDLKVLARLVPGLRLPAAFDPFEQAVRAIIGQQISVKAAVTITGRIVERLGEMVSGCQPDMPCRLFPTPDAIADDELLEIGIPGKRVAALRGFAHAVAQGRISLGSHRTADELVNELLMLPGIGPWTAQYIALRAFGEKDAFPASDLGLLKAPLWGESGISVNELKAKAEQWRPYRAYAALLLWHNYTVAP